MRTFLTTIAVATLIAGGAHALTVSEGVDFNNGQSDALTTNVGTLDIGSNRISGSVAGNCDGSFCFFGNADTDEFIFTVGAGTEITSFGVQNEKDGTATGVVFDIFFRQSTGANNDLYLFNGLGEHPENDSKDFTSVLPVPLGAGDYFVSYFAFASAGDGTYEGFWDVLVGVEATGPTTPAVPLPASLPLLLAGMGALGVARRKRG